MGAGIIERREVPIVAWTAAPNADAYFVYRSLDPSKGWSLLNEEPTTALSFRDSAANLNTLNYYMVRSAKLRRTPSAGFMNLSVGISRFVNVNEADTTMFGNSQEAINLKDLRIYPNPTADVLSIQSGALTGETIRLENLTGQLLIAREAQRQTHSLDLSSYPAGVYVLRVGRHARRIVKE